MTNEEIWDKLNVLRGEAEYQDFKHGRGAYEWELGVDVFNEIKDSSDCELVNYGKDTVKELMGIPIRIDLVNNDKIKLWREVSI